ncbi:hypothetical protein C0V77_15485 [Emticicia sp. TH156]|nr:hypothetical protein C0V77_15485 [Emticicia sp. TH156]
MLKRVLYIILFMSLSGLLYANQRHTVSLYFPVKKTVHHTHGIPSSADDFFKVDPQTNYCFLRTVVDEQDWYTNHTFQAHSFLKENVLKDLFVQKTLNFLKNRYIYLLNCIWLI